MLASFRLAAILAGLVCAAWSVVLLRSARSQPDLPSKLSRSRLLGEIVGIPVLAWAAFHVTKMVEPGSIFIPISVGLVPVVAIVAWGHLDYLFARAFGGLLLLGANHLLTTAFMAGVPMRSAFSVCVYLLGLPGLVLVSSPWWLRDLLEKARDSARWRGAVVAVWGFYAVLFLGYAAVSR